MEFAYELVYLGCREENWENFDEVHDIVIPEFGGKKGRHMKVLVSIDLHKPILRRLMMTFQGKARWISFRYENLPTFYFYCGLIGHNEKVALKNVMILKIIVFTIINLVCFFEHLPRILLQKNL
ncbi:hypothetical protein ACH5RR_029526 [Cinchona calisaya]|uniref:Zinc knuckle CX2CX4HX4C domain-containing protein n=1 Tax=Cinchona calisaya TaxID=153742 RepID=A0ABD2YRW1_9GENT